MRLTVVQISARDCLPQLEIFSIYAARLDGYASIIMMPMMW